MSSLLLLSNELWASVICLLYHPKAVDPTEFEEKSYEIDAKKSLGHFLSDWFCRQRNVTPNSFVVKASSFPVNSSVEKVLSQQHCFQKDRLIIRTMNGSSFF